MIRVLPAVSEPTHGAVDGFGRRMRGLDSDSGDEVELLELSPVLVEHAGFVSALGDRVQNVAMTGGVDVRSDPPGARVTIDGQLRGTTPVTIRDLAPGDHQVVLEAGGRKVNQVVRIDAGITAQLVVPLPRR